MNNSVSESAPKRQRVNRSIEQWRALLQAQQASGLSQESYCQAEGVSSTAFAKWRKRFRDERSASAVVKAASPEFIELPRLARSPESVVQTGVKLRLELGSGIVLELTRL